MSEQETVLDGTGRRPAGRRTHVCPECGFRLRLYRESKRCGRCKETKPVSEYNHHRGRGDHRMGECRSCQRARQAAGYRKDNFTSGGAEKVIPLAEINPLVSDYLVGRFKSKRRLAEYQARALTRPRLSGPTLGR